MSNRERRRELIFGILYTIGGIFLLFGGMAAEAPQLMLTGFIFLGIAVFSWIKLAVHSPSKPRKERPIKQNAAHMAREAELAAQKQQVELNHQSRKEAYLKNPVPLQIRQWNQAFRWDWDFKRKPLNQTLYIKQTGSGDLDLSRVSFQYMDSCVIHQKDGIWYLRPVSYNAQVRMNSEAARNKCAGMPVNTQEFTVPRNTDQELLPGDCFVVIQGPIVCYFRIDKLSAV